MRRLAVLLSLLALVAWADPESDEITAATANLYPNVDTERREAAALGLYSIRRHIHHYPGTVAVLIHTGLQDRSRFVREMSASTLGYSRTKLAVAPLIELAASGLPEASLALGRLGEIATSALPTLKRLIGTETPEGRAAAARAIHDLSGDSSPATNIIKELAPLEDLGWNELHTLGPIAPSLANAAPSLRPLIDARKVKTRAYAIAALLRMGVTDAEVVNAARKMFKLPSEAPVHMLHALRDAGIAVKPVAKDVLELFKHKWRAQFAVYVIGGMGEDARPYLKQIASLFDSDSIEARANAALAHWRVTRDAKAIVPVMRSVLQTWGPKGTRGYFAAQTTLELVIEIGPGAAPLKHSIAELAKQESAHLLRPVARIALEELRRCG